MKLDLAVIGRGAVTPAGIGVEALRKIQPVAVEIAGVRKPKETWPVLRVDLNPLQRWQREPRLRRASSITLFLIEAAEQALAGLSPEARAKTGLIIAFSAGCLAYSRRFFEGIVKEGQNRASPALFPETVFNSPGSHVAAALKLNGAVYALCGDEGSWVAALKTAAIWLQAGRVGQVLVLGAEEFDPLALDAYKSARWLRKSSSHPFFPAEGAAGLLVRQAQPGDKVVLSEARDGFIYRTSGEAAVTAKKLFRDIHLPCYLTAKNTWLGALEKKMTAGRRLLPEKNAPYLGEAFTASAAWNTLRALEELSRETPALALPLWGLNHQLGLIELNRRD